MASDGRKSRRERLKILGGVPEASSSQDVVVLIQRIYRTSKDYADKTDGNCSPYAYCGIPLLLSALRLLMIEFEYWPFGGSFGLTKETAKILAGNGDLIGMLQKYRAPQTLLQEAAVLIEVRNEIIHPVHITSTLDHCPEYLRVLKDQGLFQSTGKADADYNWFAQLASHRLFAWPCRVARDIARTVVNSASDKGDFFKEMITSYDRIGFEDDLQPAG